MLVTAPRDFRYGKTLYKKGETFEAKDNHARFLVRAMKFTAESDLNVKKPKKRRYKRRDMTAE